MKITIISVGKIKEKYYRDAVAEYAKRLGRYCRLEIMEAEDEKTPDGAGATLEDKIESLMVQGISHLQFIIGGSLGLHERVCARADLSLSFSELTFPHQLMRVILLEQIYRCFRIIHKEPYHK